MKPIMTVLAVTLALAAGGCVSHGYGGPTYSSYYGGYDYSGGYGAYGYPGYSVGVGVHSGSPRYWSGRRHVRRSLH